MLTVAQVENQPAADIAGRPTAQHIIYSIFELPNCPPATDNSSDVDNRRAFGSITDVLVV